MINKLLIVAFMCISCAVHAAHRDRRVQFVSEIITISVSDSFSFHVDGEYVFNEEEAYPEPYTIFYPIPTDSVMLFPLDFNAFQENAAIKFRPDPLGSGFYCPIQFAWTPLCTLSVHYTQAATMKRGRYILTSTSAWKKNLIHGRYILNTLSTIEMTKVNYPADTVVTIGDTTRYIFEKKNFMPQKDIVFSWKVASENRGLPAPASADSLAH